MFKRNTFSLMVQGTTSDAGKTTIVAGLCRMLARLDKRVVPFKPQNMALNSVVTEDGGEIGRAQALQAQACGLTPHTDMNPILIKPSSDTNAQIIVQGKVLQDMHARNFHTFKPQALAAVLASYNRLKKQADYIIIEGAGSPAEINLREGDIANMGFAEPANCPVVIVADIDKGGVFAHLVGTLELLSSSEQNRVIGFFINKFRGEIALLQSGLDWLEERTNKPVLGVIPYVHQLYLDAEDAIVTQQFNDIKNPSSNRFKICVPVLPRISNHTDFDALRLNPAVDLTFISIFDEIPSCDLLILPGSKNVREDLQHLLKNGWREKVLRHLRYDGKLLGICGGYQMLGLSIDDPQGIEGKSGVSEGFKLLPLHTVLEKNKILDQIEAHLRLHNQRVEVKGYEIHCGRTSFSVDGYLDHTDGSHEKKIAPIEYSMPQERDSILSFLSEDNAILGTYVHGLFDTPDAANLILKWAGCAQSNALELNTVREAELDRISDTLKQTINFEKFNLAIDTFYARSS